MPNFTVPQSIYLSTISVVNPSIFAVGHNVHERWRGRLREEEPEKLAEWHPLLCHPDDESWLEAVRNRPPVGQYRREGGVDMANLMIEWADLPTSLHYLFLERPIRSFRVLSDAIAVGQIHPSEHSTLPPEIVEQLAADAHEIWRKLNARRGDPHIRRLNVDYAELPLTPNGQARRLEYLAELTEMWGQILKDFPRTA